MIYIILIIIIAYLLVRSRKLQTSEYTEQKTDDEKLVEEKSYAGCYQRKYLLTKNEYGEYKKLREYATQKHLIICPKVRLLDIIEPRHGRKDYTTLMRKIQSKHVDFVICDENLYIQAILELDDSSHDQQDRKARDLFVDEILTSVGYKVIRTRSITEQTLNGIGVTGN